MAVEPQDNPVLSAVTVVVYRCAPFLIPREAVALQDLTLNVNEAMGTGGWVPTPLHASFWAAMSDSLAAIAAATGAQAGEGAGRG